MLKNSSVKDATKARYAEIIDAMPHLVWTADSEGTFDFFNRQWLDYTRQTLDHALSHGFRGVVHPDDLESTADAWRNSIALGTTFECEYQMLRVSQGVYRWHLGRAIPVKNPIGQIEYWIGTSTEIDSQKRHQTDLSDMLARAMDAASIHQTFMRQVLRTMSNGGLCLCDTGLDLPPMRTQLLRGMSLSDQTFGLLRDEIHRIALQKGFSSERCDDLITAVGEAAMNALIYCGGGTARVHSDDTGTLQVWIEDAGPTASTFKPIRDQGMHIGHGFRLMVAMADKVWLLAEPDGTTVVIEQEL